MLKRRLTLLAALFFGALGVLAHGGVRVVHRFIVLRAVVARADLVACLLYTSPSPRDLSTSRMPSSA